MDDEHKCRVCGCVVTDPNEYPVGERKAVHITPNRCLDALLVEVARLREENAKMRLWMKPLTDVWVWDEDR